MYEQVEKPKENKSRAVANSVTQKKSNGKQGFGFVDNRPQAMTLRKLQSPGKYSISQTLQKKENNTGLPDNLKSGIENLSGYSMDDVKVHYNSEKPALLNAHAYAQGNDIHLASEQEKYLPHEAWHVAQQKQGRVKPTLQMKGKLNVNDDARLEKEADVMGAKAFQFVDNHSSHLPVKSIFVKKFVENTNVLRAPIQGAFVMDGNTWRKHEKTNLKNKFLNHLNQSKKLKVTLELVDTFLEQLLDDEKILGVFKDFNELTYQYEQFYNQHKTGNKTLNIPIAVSREVLRIMKFPSPKLGLPETIDFLSSQVGDVVNIKKKLEDFVSIMNKASIFSAIVGLPKQLDVFMPLIETFQEYLNEFSSEKITEYSFEELSKLEDGLFDTNMIFRAFTWKMDLLLTWLDNSRTKCEEDDKPSFDIDLLNNINSAIVDADGLITKHIREDLLAWIRQGKFTASAVGRAHEAKENQKQAVDNTWFKEIEVEGSTLSSEKGLKKENGPRNPFENEVVENLEITGLPPKSWRKKWDSAPDYAPRPKGGQIGQMNGISASKYALSVLPDKNMAKSRKWEWLHILAASLGGSTDPSNLVLGTEDTNTQMMPFEKNLLDLAHLVKRKCDSFSLEASGNIVGPYIANHPHTINKIEFQWGIKANLETRGLKHSGKASFFPINNNASLAKQEVERIQGMLAAHRKGIQKTMNSPNSGAENILEESRKVSHVPKKQNMGKPASGTLTGKYEGSTPEVPKRGRTGVQVERNRTSDLEDPKGILRFWHEYNEWKEKKELDRKRFEDIFDD